MPKVKKSNWIRTPAEVDYDSATNYLSLLLPDETAQVAVQRLRNAPMVTRRADDLIRAGGLSALPDDDPSVARKLKDLKRGRLLSPVLCLRGDLNGTRR